MENTHHSVALVGCELTIGTQFPPARDLVSIFCEVASSYQAKPKGLWFWMLSRIFLNDSQPKARAKFKSLSLETGYGLEGPKFCERS